MPNNLIGNLTIEIVTNHGLLSHNKCVLHPQKIESYFLSKFRSILF